MDILSINDQQGQYPESYYTATAKGLAEHTSLKGEVRADVCIVGAGYTGLSAALHLAEGGFDVVLLDAHRVGFGASGRNGGQVAGGQNVGQDDLVKKLGEVRAKALWDISLDSVSLVKSLIENHNIDCGFAPGILHADHRARFVAHSHDYAHFLQKTYGYDLIQPLDRAETQHLVGSPHYHGGTLDMGGGHLHPLNYALGLAKAAKSAGVRIFENSRVTDLGEMVKTELGQVKAAHVILACNGYHGDIDKALSRRVMPINNFIIATEPLNDETAKNLIRENHAVADSRFVVNYFRLSQDNRLLFGGGESYGYRFPRDIVAKVRKPMLEVFPQLAHTKIDYAWGGTLGITMSRMPHFAKLNDKTLSAAGFSGHGVAMATLAGKMLAEAINGKAGQFDLMADVTTPRFPGGAMLRWPLLVAAMTWYSLRDRF